MQRSVVALLLAAATAPLASANVIGIDFGTEFMKVALVQPGSPLEIVTNTVSKRKSETVVAFVRGERLFAARLRTQAQKRDVRDHGEERNV